MKIRTSTFTEPSTPYLPSYDATSGTTVEVSFFVTGRKWRRRELVIGSRVFPLGNWRPA